MEKEREREGSLEETKAMERSAQLLIITQWHNSMASCKVNVSGGEVGILEDFTGCNRNALCCRSQFVSWDISQLAIIADTW